MNARMNHECRFWLSFSLSLALMLGAAMCWAAPVNTAPEFSEPQQGTLQPGQRLQIPPIPKTVDPYPVNKKAILEANRKELHGDVERLFTLAQDLKDQTEKADAAQVVSVDFIASAKEIEKLSKKIQKLARN